MLQNRRFPKYKNGPHGYDEVHIDQMSSIIKKVDSMNPAF